MQISWRDFPRSASRLLRTPPVIWRSTRGDGYSTIELRAWLPVAAFLLTLLWYLASPSPVGIMTLTALGAILLLSFAWARHIALQVRGQRELQYAAVQVGDELEERVSIENPTFLPVFWAEFVDRSNLPGYSVAGVAAADADSTAEWRAHTVCARRGVFLLGPWELQFADPFGLFLARQVYTARQEVLVHPPLAALPRQLLPHGGSMGDHRPQRQSLPAESINAVSTRPYAPGDPMRHIHWRTTARHDSPFVKTFQPEAASSIWLLPDCDSDAHLGESEETMVTLAASLASELLEEQLAVGLLFDDGEMKVLPPQRGTPHLWTVLRALAPLTCHPERPLAATLTRAKTVVGPRDLVVVLTPSLDPEWARELRQLTWNGHSSNGEAILLDPASFGGKEAIEPFIQLLAELSLTCRVIRQGDIQPLAASYGELNRWEFVTLPLGAVRIKRAPRALSQQAGPMVSTVNQVGAVR